METCTSGSEGGRAQQCARPTRPSSSRVRDQSGGLGGPGWGLRREIKYVRTLRAAASRACSAWASRPWIQIIIEPSCQRQGRPLSALLAFFWDAGSAVDGPPSARPGTLVDLNAGLTIGQFTHDPCARSGDKGQPLREAEGTARQLTLNK